MSWCANTLRYFSRALFLFSLLTVVKAPAKVLWFFAIAVTEWGHLLAIGAFALAYLGRKRWPGDRLSWGMALASGFLLLTPLLRAYPVAKRLPSEMAAAFGRPVVPGKPLSLRTLVWATSEPPAQVRRMPYATVGAKTLTLDLYQPVQRQPSPMPGILIIHGGSWQSGDPQELPALNRHLAAKGYIVAALEYRLAPEAIFPAPVEDVEAAMRFLNRQAADLGLDATRWVLLGRSAGGQIALSAAYQRHDPSIRGVVVLYAPNDLVWAYGIPCNPFIMNCQKVIETYLGGKPSPGVYEAASPLLAVNANTPPTLMIHGDRDELVSPLHEVRLAERLSAAGRPHYILKLPWATHGCDANLHGPCGQLSTYAIERFLEQTLR